MRGEGLEEKENERETGRKGWGREGEWYRRRGGERARLKRDLEGE